MKARPNRPTAGDVRGLMAELGDLVEDLGLETPKPAPPVAPADEPPAPAPVEELAPEAAAAPVDAEPEPAVPMWETVEDPHPAVQLWEAFAPELTQAATSPTPWSPAAAMVPLQPVAPATAAAAAVAVPAQRRSLWDRRPHLFTVVTVAAVLVAAAVFAFSHLDLGHTSGPPQAVAQSAFEVTGLRTVSAASPQRVPGAPTSRRFLTTAGAIYLDVSYRNVTAQDTLRILILLQSQQNGEPPSTVSDNSHTGLPPSGEVAITVEAPPGGFAPGTYTVRALHDGHLDQTWSFEVAPPGGAQPTP